MGKDVAQLIRNIRTTHKLTQKQFADKFYVTDKTISNYERGLRTPSLEFLNKILEEFGMPFDYTLDYYFKDTSPGDPRRLVVARNEMNKCALFNTANSSYLTGHLYDRIFINKYGYHIAFNVKEVVDKDSKGEEYKSEEITESFLIDNYGNVKQFKDLLFGFQGQFDLFGCCLAYSKIDNAVFLVDSNGNKLSKGYRRIYPVNFERNYGLYFAVRDFDTEDIVLLTKNVELCAEIMRIYGRDFLVEKNFDTFLKYIEDCGPNILELLYQKTAHDTKNRGTYYYSEGFILDQTSKYLDIIKAVDKFVENNYSALKKLEDENILPMTEIFDYTLELLKEFVRVSQGTIVGNAKFAERAMTIVCEYTNNRIRQNIFKKKLIELISYIKKKNDKIDWEEFF